MNITGQLIRWFATFTRPPIVLEFVCSSSFASGWGLRPVPDLEGYGAGSLVELHGYGVAPANDPVALWEVDPDA